MFLPRYYGDLLRLEINMVQCSLYNCAQVLDSRCPHESFLEMYSSTLLEMLARYMA